MYVRIHLPLRRKNNLIQKRNRTKVFKDTHSYNVLSNINMCKSKLKENYMI